jgi:hypothetical protein
MSLPGALDEAHAEDGSTTSVDVLDGRADVDVIDGRATGAASDASTAVRASSSAIVCPYLFVPGASWRATRPLREHRCMAVSPIDAPTMEMQRGVCLTAAYATCPLFEAALDARRARWSGSPESLAAFEARVARRVPRVAPVALDRPSAIAGPLSLLGGSRRVARVALAAAMVGAAGLLLAARFAGGGGIGASPEPTTPAAIATPTEALASSSASPSLPATSTPSPSPAASSAPAKTPKPATTHRYIVKSGDTLSGIAKRLGTTVAVLKKLNGIGDASRIRPGQVLVVP